MNWEKQYGDTEGPLGFPMRDEDAKALDAFIKTLPEQDYQKVVVEKATSELLPGERADVSWISTEAIDRQKEIVLVSGFRDDHYKANPIVTMSHDYMKPPVGRSLWRKKIRDGSMKGIKAKTVYPARPDEWKSDQTWMPDVAFSLVKSGLMTGKSIGYLAVKSHSPTDEEVRKNEALSGVYRIVDEWVLCEYACCWLPVNPEAITEAVAKSADVVGAFKAIGVEVKLTPEAKTPENYPHLAVSEIKAEVERQLKKVTTSDFIKKTIEETYDRLRGRV